MRKILFSLVIISISFTTSKAQDSIVISKPGISAQVKNRISKSKDRLVIELCMMNAIVKTDGVFCTQWF
jgi:hypothetical protein